MFRKNALDTHEAASERFCSVVARTDERSSGRVGGHSDSSSSSSRGGQRFAEVRTVGVETVMSRGVTGMQVQRALVHVFALLFGFPIEEAGIVVARLKTGRACRGTTITAVNVHATLAYPANRYPIGTFVDICHVR